MASELSGDYSKFPPVIKDAMAYLSGETCVLRQSWGVYNRLFMESEALTGLMAKFLGRLMGTLQVNLQDGMILSIARLTDKDNRAQKNLSVWSLIDAIPLASNQGFKVKVDQALADITKSADNIRIARHKRIAHLDRGIAEKSATLPSVTVIEILHTIELIENYLNLYNREFEGSTTLFREIGYRDITNDAERSVIKAFTYDIFEEQGAIPKNEWVKQLRRFLKGHE